MTELATVQHMAPARWVEPLWCKQGFESDEQFQAFESMKQLPSKARNMQSVARYCGIEYEQVLDWCNRFHWKTRLQAYDSYMANDAATLEQRLASDARVQHLGLIDLGIEVLRRELVNLRDRQRTLDAQGANVSLMKPSELSNMLRDLIKLDRLVMGEATERAESFDLSKFTDDELMQWHALMSKAKPVQQ